METAAYLFPFVISAFISASARRACSWTKRAWSCFESFGWSWAEEAEAEEAGCLSRCGAEVRTCGWGYGRRQRLESWWTGGGCWQM